MLYTYHLTTPVSGFVSITAQVKGAVAESGVQSGICVVYCPHTTAGITINENADPDVQRDLLLAYAEAFPDRKAFRHAEGNSAAHAKASAMAAVPRLLSSRGSFCWARGRAFIFASLTAFATGHFTSRFSQMQQRKTGGNHNDIRPCNLTNHHNHATVLYFLAVQRVHGERHSGLSQPRWAVSPKV